MCCSRVVSQQCLLRVCLLLVILIVCALAGSLFFDEWMRAERTAGYCSNNCTSIRLWRSCPAATAAAESRQKQTLAAAVEGKRTTTTSTRKFYSTEIECFRFRKDLMQFYRRFELDLPLVLLLASVLLSVISFVACAGGACQRRSTGRQQQRASCASAFVAVCLLLASLCCAASVGFFEFRFNRRHFFTPDRGVGLYAAWGTSLVQFIASIIALRAACTKPRVKACERTVYGIQMRDASQPPPPVAPGYESGGRPSPEFADDFNQGPPGYEESIAGREYRYSGHISQNASAPLMHGRGYHAHAQQLEYAPQQKNGRASAPSYAESVGYASPYEI